MKRLLLYLLLLLPFGAFAQTEPLPVLCGNEVLDHILQTHYQDLRQSIRATFDQTAQTTAASNRSPLTVRVVVHVVWKNPEENLPDSVILSQIAVLNEDYNRQNPDTANLRPVFQPVAGNPQIQFELADILRVQTNQNFQLNLLGNEILSNLKSTADGGSDAWDTESYLNIWICNIQPISLGGITLGQVLGFAFPPNNLGNWPANSGAPSPDQDGVVLDFRTVGRNNPNPLPSPGGTGNLVVRGRTASHEVGHYLGLRHIWGDGGLFGLPNNCNESDGINDTPFANAQSPFDCNKTRNSCNKIEPFYGMDMPDLVENYMDYSSESCMNMFSQGQADHMRNVLNGPRSGLIQFSSSTQSPVAATRLRLLPNPVSDQARLLFTLEQPEQMACRLFSADGRLQWQSPNTLFPSGNHEITIPSEQLKPGVYFLRAGKQVATMVKL
jgi:hypothetical protein